VHSQSTESPWIIANADTGEQVKPAPWSPDTYADRQQAYDAMVNVALSNRYTPEKRQPLSIRPVA
jgi:hypothetical protein